MAELNASARGGAAPSWYRRWRAAVRAAIATSACVLLSAHFAFAIEAIPVEPNQDKIEITSKGELYEGRGDRLQIETAPGRDGYIGRMAVSASIPGTNPGWLVFALSNPTSERIVRWLVAPRYTLANSRVFWPIPDPQIDPAPLAATASWPERLYAFADRVLVIDHFHWNLWSSFGSAPFRMVRLGLYMIVTLAIVVGLRRRAREARAS